MITEIHMDAVASFRHATSLKTDKKINLIYGLNGTGKSTISNFLYNPTNNRFNHCAKIPDNTAPILVYNQDFIKDNFYVADSLKGVFSLSKENKDAEEKITKAVKTQNDLEESLQDRRNTKDQVKHTFTRQRQIAVDEAWKIKSEYSGGDRILEYCLDGLKGQKEKLFSHLRETPKPVTKPKKSIQELRDEVEALKGESAQPQTKLPQLSFSANEVESDAIFSTSILGNTDSEVAALIDKLGNSDWVKQGLSYLPEDVDGNAGVCPFCQEVTITSTFVSSVKGYFDETYEQQLEALGAICKRYRSEIEALPDHHSFTDHPFARERAGALLNKYQVLISVLRNNLNKIEEKIKSPKAPVKLDDSVSALSEFNEEVGAINEIISEYNERLTNRDAALASLRGEFWSLMRWHYDQTITRFDEDRHVANQKLKKLDSDMAKIKSDITEAKSQIAAAQKETVNIDEAVSAINVGLLVLGIDDFKISRHSENLYRVVRAGDSKHVFHTLSEGEKMMISFLYFCELCKGKTSADDTHAQRIAVIDDPISSLSHVFIFNVGQLIRSIFFKSERFSQVFVLTHSLYFFYELTDPNHDRRKQNQKLFRIFKTSAGSDIQEMKYEEVQNDYQAYWSVVNDSTQPPALIANCMRNIVEYFFNFVRKKDLNNVFLMPELQDAKFQAFYRYINRESHSLGQNIIDMKEFDYETFKEGLRLIFEKTGYIDHFNAMSKI